MKLITMLWAFTNSKKQIYLVINTSLTFDSLLRVREMLKISSLGHQNTSFSHLYIFILLLSVAGVCVSRGK